MAKNFNELDPIVHVGKGTIKTLATSAEFYANKKEEELPFRESNLSRLDVSLISKAEGKTDVLMFNVPAREINELKLKTDIAVNYLMTSIPAESAVTNEGDLPTSLAFTVPLIVTNFKGKTPGEVLLADPSKKNELLKNREFLVANLAKFQNNQKQIDAIDDAIKLLEIGELSGYIASKPSLNKVLTIYKREFKYKSKKDENGNNLVYSVNITCDSAKNNPFTIEIMNCYAPVVSGANGQTIVKTQSAINTKRISMSLTDSEWISLVGQAYDLYQNFKRVHALNAFKRAAENSYSPN